MEPIVETRDDILGKYRKGLVQVYTGNGKGKTTAAFGQALRAIGQGFRVCVIQFMKGRKYGEFLAGEKYLPNLTLHLAGLDSFVMRENPAPLDIELARQGLALARKAITSGDYDMVILDELNVAADFKLIPLADVIDLIKSKPAVSRSYPYRPLRPAGGHRPRRHGERDPGGPSPLQRRRSRSEPGSNTEKQGSAHPSVPERENSGDPYFRLRIQGIV